MKHVIIEGPDGAGKTRLARELCARYGMGYHHEGPPPPGVDLTAYYAKLLVNATRPTVFDRLYLGELVYGPLLRGGSRVSAYDLRMLHRLVVGTGSTVVTCLPDFCVCLENNQAKTELITDQVTLRDAYDAWDLVFNAVMTIPNRQPHSYTRQVGPFLVRDKSRLPEGCVGSPTAKILFVGEQANGDLDLPFFRTGRSSVYLNRALSDAGVPEADLALVNTLNRLSRPNDLPFVISQMPVLRTVVALGKIAAIRLKQNCPPFVNVIEIPHPQYWSRFHAAETDRYTAMLKEAYDVAR